MLKRIGKWLEKMGERIGKALIKDIKLDKRDICPFCGETKPVENEYCEICQALGKDHKWHEMKERRNEMRRMRGRNKHKHRQLLPKML